MNDPTTVTYPVADILTRIEEKLEKLNTIEVQIATLTEKVNGIDKRLEKGENTQDILVKEVSDLKGVKSLVIPIVVAVATALLTLLFRLIPNVPH